MQLIKLVYVAHGYMLGRHGVPLLEEEVQAWQFGPVVRSVYNAVRKFRSATITHIEGSKDLEFSPQERAVMDEVVRRYGSVDGVALSSATHKPETPWSKTWGYAGRNAAISNDLIEHFYKVLLKQPRHSAL